MSRKPVDILLRHMLDAAHEAVEHLSGRSRDELHEDRQLQHSLIRCIEIIGEAASRIEPEFRDANPLIPWLDIIAMRNRLIHAYFDIDLEIVWSTVRDELPELVQQIEQVLNE